MIDEDFHREFPDEETCVARIRAIQEPGMVCRKCGGSVFYWIKTFQWWKCKKCEKRRTLTGGTFMTKSKVPLQKWMHAIWILSRSARPVSIQEIQRRVGLSRYDTAYRMVRKIRSASKPEDIREPFRVILDQNWRPKASRIAAASSEVRGDTA